NYKILNDLLVIEDKKNVILFDSASLLISTIAKTKNLTDAIVAFKNYKRQACKNVNQKDVFQKDHNNMSICLLLSNDCNLNCKYCYADGGSYSDVKGKMDNKSIDESLKFISKNFKDEKKLNISFFGGEPLLFPKSIKYFIERSKTCLPNTKLSFGLTTNGTILNDEIFSLLKNNRIYFQISLDGDKSIQDDLRSTKTGQGSYDRIFKNLEQFKKIKKNLVFRTTITPKNLYLSKIYNHFKVLGAKKVHFEIIGTSPCSPLYFNNQTIKIYKTELNKLAKIYYKDFVNENKPINISNFTKFFKHIHFGLKKYKNCAVFNNLIAINFKGAIYPCHRFVGMKNYKLGDISQNFDINKSHVQIKNIEKHPSCKKCFARYLCGGGCYHNSLYTLEAKKLFSSPHCAVYRHSVFLSIWLYANLIQSKKRDNFIKFIESSISL
ncbi:MAG: hypothetical protein K940chlam1_01196, partial [Candidatus Anoxychlamydiales bacterium]|nr:hypothetical protein [Candidatus Anoxychlamydiales bacterium]